MPSNLMTRYRVPNAWPTARGPASPFEGDLGCEDVSGCGANPDVVVVSSVPVSIDLDGVTSVRPSSVPAETTGVAMVTPASRALNPGKVAGRSSEECTRSLIISLMDESGNHYVRRCCVTPLRPTVHYAAHHKQPKSRQHTPVARARSADGTWG